MLWLRGFPKKAEAISVPGEPQLKGARFVRVRQYYVYLMTNAARTVIYTGVTSNLKSRTYQHKNGVFEGFTKRYRVTSLVYYETFGDIREAMAREKQIKAGNRKRKMEMVDSLNPSWIDLHDHL